MKYLPANSSLRPPPTSPTPPLKLIYLSNSLSTLHSLISGATATNFLLSSEMRRKKTPVTFDKMDVQRLFFFLRRLSERRNFLFMWKFSVILRFQFKSAAHPRVCFQSLLKLQFHKRHAFTWLWPNQDPQKLEVKRRETGSVCKPCYR